MFKDFIFQYNSLIMYYMRTEGLILLATTGAACTEFLAVAIKHQDKFFFFSFFSFFDVVVKAVPIEHTER